MPPQQLWVPKDPHKAPACRGRRVEKTPTSTASPNVPERLVDRGTFGLVTQGQRLGTTGHVL